MSTIPTFILTPDGLIKTPYQVESLAAAVEHEPEGVYTTVRTFQRDHALLLSAHLDRLTESAQPIAESCTRYRVLPCGALIGGSWPTCLGWTEYPTPDPPSRRNIISENAR